MKQKDMCKVLSKSEEKELDSMIEDEIEEALNSVSEKYDIVFIRKNIAWEYEEFLEIKTEIIGELLFKYIHGLSKEYKEYLKVEDWDILSDEGIYIWIDSIYDEEEFNDNKIYELYLIDFEDKCKRFIEKIHENLSINGLQINEEFHNGKYMDEHGGLNDSCNLHFIIGD